MVKIKDTQFCVKNLKMKRKKNDKKCLTFRSGDSNSRFSLIFPPTIWIFIEGEGDEIKSRQGSYNFLTLPQCTGLGKDVLGSGLLLLLLEPREKDNKT